MISVAVVTLNEEKVLRECLESVESECDEIVIVDLGSDDETLRIAKEFGAKVFTHARVEYVELVRNFAISKASGGWILVLDPDERMSKTLWIKLKELLAEGRYEAFNIPRKNIFFGVWIRHTNWWPDRHVRFFQKEKVSWNEKIHLYPKVEGRILDLPAKESLAINHFSYLSIEDFMSRQSRYSMIDAKNLYADGVRFSWKGFIWRPVRELLVRYIRHMGFLDGKYGFFLTYLMMIYQLQVMINLWEMEQKR